MQRHLLYILYFFTSVLKGFIFSSSAVLLFFQRFTNEDHLSVHKHKHEMTLKFGPARTDSVIIAGIHIIIDISICKNGIEFQSDKSCQCSEHLC